MGCFACLSVSHAYRARYPRIMSLSQNFAAHSLSGASVRSDPRVTQRFIDSLWLLEFTAGEHQTWLVLLELAKTGGGGIKTLFGVGRAIQHTKLCASSSNGYRRQ